ncbi:MAG TPA: tetratricopeptide repeat protein [Enhygromyxa sp.]|nr:tetratricopeptide repeat protein [Enhygromyxa sp.]
MNQHAQPPNDSPSGLQRYIAAARAQPIVETNVSADAVMAGLEAHRRRTQGRRTLLLSAGVAMAASLIAAAVLWPLLSARVDDESRSDEPSAALERGSAEPTGHALANAVRMRSTAPVEVLGPWSIALHEGTHELEVDAVADHALTIALPGRTLELLEGSMTIEFVGHEAAVRLHTGVAAWVAEDGQRSQISVEHFELDAPQPESNATEDDPSRPLAPSAAELARSAEQALAAGKRVEAVTLYRQLIRKHPRASQTRAAVLDLARLLRVGGQTDEARCAYRLYLERWPDSSVRAEVEAQLDRLGEGPRCRGLRPSE